MAMSVSDIALRLDRIESLLTTLVQTGREKEWYTTSEVADLTGRAEFTVREWCRLGRVTAQKAVNGQKRQWRIGHEELQRILNHGPRPLLPRN